MIILASKSPRRAELLSLITTDFGVVPSDADEKTDIPDPQDIVAELAKRKAEAVAKSYPDDIVIGADTVVYADGEILGKPKDRQDAFRMIQKLAAKTHEVWTGVCVKAPGRDADCRSSGSLVTFTAISEEEARRYADTEDVLDKAGAYAIQGAAAKFIDRIDGSCSGVMGFPVSVVYRMLKRAGLKPGN